MENFIKCGSKNLFIGKKTYIMGVINITPDSFGHTNTYFKNIYKAVARIEDMIVNGVDIIDIGGESTRPFSKKINQKEEVKRILPLIKLLIKRGIDYLSVDTRNSLTARICLAEGVSWINDISALTYDINMIDVVKKADAIVLMHSKDNPDVMQKGNVIYKNVVLDVKKYLKERVEFVVSKGILRQKIIIDPGLGFGKTMKHNLEIINKIQYLQEEFGNVLLGPSRKSFLGKLFNIEKPFQRDIGTNAVCSFAYMNNISFIRVHNVKDVVITIKTLSGIKYKK